METTDNLPPPLCPICGGTAFTWGVARGSGYRLDFVPGLNLWQQLQSLAGTPLEARACDRCGNVALFLKGRGAE